MNGFKKAISITTVFMVFAAMPTAWADEEDFNPSRSKLPREAVYSPQAAEASQTKAEVLVQNKQDIDSLIVESATLASIKQRVAADLGQIDVALASIQEQSVEETLWIDSKTSDVVMLKTVKAALSRSFGQAAAAHESAIEKYSPVVTSVIKVIRGDYMNDLTLLQNPEDKENLRSARNKIATYAQISFVRENMMLDQQQLMKLFLISKKSFMSNPIFTMEEAMLIGKVVFAAQERLAVL